MTLPYVCLTGDAYEQGRQHGRLLREAIAYNLNLYFDRFEREVLLSRPEVLAWATRYGPAIAQQNRDYYAGMVGIADGGGFDLTEIVALNVRYEILYYQSGVMAIEQARDGCTAFAVAPMVSANGHLLLGQNWDWIPDVLGAVLKTVHPAGHTTLAFTEAGIFGGKIGLNSAGLGLAINGISATNDDWTTLAKPYHVRCYEVLLQSNFDKAVACITDTDRACSANYLIAQTPDLVADIEAAPNTFNRLGWQNGCLVHANHFVDPAGIDIRETPNEFRSFSCKRQERLEKLLAMSRPVTIEAIKEHLSDHLNLPRAICRHEEPTAPIDEQYRTITGVIIDLHAKTMHISDGPPCQKEWQSLEL